MKLWKGRFQKEADPKTNDFNSSISIDSRMFREDIEGSIAHASMLGKQGIIEKGESEKICAELKKLREDLESGALFIDPDAEDIHTFVEQELTARLGRYGKAAAYRPQQERSGRRGPPPLPPPGDRRDRPADPGPPAGRPGPGQPASGNRDARLHPTSNGPNLFLSPITAGLW